MNEQGWARAVVLGAALVASGCPSSVTYQPVREIPADAKAFVAKPADRYALDQPPPAGLDADLTREFEHALTEQLPAEARVRLRRDTSLDAVAAVVADVFFEREQFPPHSLLQWMFWRAGSTAIYGSCHATFGGEGPRDEKLDSFTRGMARDLLSGNTAHVFGLARFKARGHYYAQAMVMGTRPLDLPSFGKSVAPGAALDLGTLASASGSSMVAYLGGVGTDVLRAPVVNGAVHFDAPTASGRYFLEVVHESDRQGYGPSALAWVPVYVGVPEPDAPDPFLVAPAPNPPDVAAFAEAIRADLSSARGAAGLPPLADDAALTRVAAATASAFAVGARVKATPGVAVYTTRFVNVHEHAALRLLHPAERRRAMDRSVTRVGIGVTATPADHFGNVGYVGVEAWPVPK